MLVRPAPPGLLRGVIFDLGGTLIVPDRYEEANRTRLIEWAEARGLPAGSVADRAVEEARDWMWGQTAATGRQFTAREALARAAEALAWPQEDAFLEEAIRTFFIPEVSTARLYPDAIVALGALQDMGMRLGLISNASDHGLIEGILDRTSLAPFFSPVLSSAVFGRIKPDPGIFHQVLSTWECPAEAAVMVGDTLDADIAGAQSAGMRTILVTMHPHPSNVQVAERITADAQAGTLTEVVEIVRGWNQTHSTDEKKN